MALSKKGKAHHLGDRTWLFVYILPNNYTHPLFQWLSVFFFRVEQDLKELDCIIIDLGCLKI